MDTNDAAHPLSKHRVCIATWHAGRLPRGLRLLRLVARTAVPGRLEELYILMYEMTIIGKDDVRLAQAWLADLLAVGYRFPPLVSAGSSAGSPAAQS